MTLLSDRAVRATVLGLLLALLVAVGAGWWLQAQGLRQQADFLAERGAIVSLRAVTEIVERLGIENERVPEAVADIAESDPGLELVRVVRFKGIRLVASTAPEDSGEQAAPRKLAREEKPIYDRGQSLRQSVEANVDEGRAWKEEIDVQSLESGGLDLAGPVEEGGKIVGAVFIETSAAEEAGRPSGLATLAAVAFSLLVLVLIGSALRERQWILLAVAALVVLAAVVAYGTISVSALAKARHATEETLSSQLSAQLEDVRGVLSRVGVAEEPTLDPAVWDTDRFRQSRGLQTAAGVAQDKVEAELARERSSYWKLMIPPGLLALLLLAWVGLGSAARTGQTLVRYRRAYFYALPAMAGMILLVFFPFFYGIALSFTNSNIYNTDKGITEIWTGLANYTDILTDVDIVKTTDEGRVWDYQNFYWTLGFTILWTVSNVAIGVGVGLFLALILNTRGLAIRPIYRVLLILPWAMPNYITALIWNGFFHSQFGVINQAIQIFGGSPLSWYDTPFTSYMTVLACNGWLSFPFMMVISLGALQSIPADLYEAARVDGATRWQQFRTITLPSLKPALVPAVILSVVWTFNMFNVIYLVSGGEPGGATEILITDAYKIAFEQYRYGYAAAYSTVIFLILLTYGIWQNRVTRATEGI